MLKYGVYNGFCAAGCAAVDEAISWDELVRVCAKVHHPKNTRNGKVRTDEKEISWRWKRDYWLVSQAADRFKGRQVGYIEEERADLIGTGCRYKYPFFLFLERIVHKEGYTLSGRPFVLAWIFAFWNPEVQAGYYEESCNLWERISSGPWGYCCFSSFFSNRRVCPLFAERFGHCARSQWYWFLCSLSEARPAFMVERCYLEKAKQRCRILDPRFIWPVLSRFVSRCIIMIT